MTKIGSGVDASLSLKFNYSADEVKRICDDERKRLTLRIDEISKTPLNDAKFENSFLALENATTEFNSVVSPVIFLKDISTDEKAREMAAVCSEAVSQLLIALFAREDLYKVMKAAQEKRETLNEAENKLVEETIVSFKRNGLELSAEKRDLLVKTRQQIVSKEEAFQKRIKEMASGYVEVAQTELDGLAPDYIKDLKTTPNGKYKISLDKASVFPFMQNAKSKVARQRVSFQYNQIGGSQNVRDLEDAIKLRYEAATLLGYKNHAHYVLDRQMAKTPEKVMEFLKALIDRLKVKGKEDLKELSSFKHKERPKDPDKDIHAWEWRYYENMWKKEKFHIDSQIVREYFPLDVVLKGMFDIYQTLLGVQFVEVESAVTWHSSVRLFQIRRAGQIIAYFYLDLFPRNGKYNHFAAFELIKGYKEKDGNYRAPVCAIVGNFPKAGSDTPPLLGHDDVETLFHEFGHIMHQSLTRGIYASLSGTSVKTDFVEAPSQMFENWVWQADTLSKLSGHYKDHSKKLPPKIIDQILRARLVNSGITYLRQASLAMIDLLYHTSSNLDGKSTALYAQTVKDTMFIPIQDRTIPQAGFGHLMGGYDAGYYGYLWSKVYAQDMFTRFATEGALNKKTGISYLHCILEPGGMREPMELIKDFLGREPNQNAFLRSLGLET